MANVLDSDIAVTEFELQLRYYIPFRTNIFGKDKKLLISSYGLNSTTVVSL